MLDIKLRSASGALILGASALALACGDDGDSTTPITSASASSTTTAGSTAGNTASATPSGTPSGTPSSNGSSSAAPSSTAGGGDTCETTGYSSVSEDVPFPGVVQAFANTDEAGTTACLSTTATETCISGHVMEAGDTYQNWGSQIGFQLVQTDMNGDLVGEPWNAAALGIVGFRFTLTGVGGSTATSAPKVRLQIAMTDLDGVNYDSSAYAKGGSYTGDYSADQTATVVNFTDFSAPEWAHTALDQTLADGGVLAVPDELDSTRLHSVQLQITTDQANEHDYNVCLSSFEWLDADGNVVEVTSPVPPAGDAGTDASIPETDSSVPETDGSVPETDSSVPETDGSAPIETDASVSDAGDGGAP